MGKVSVMTKTKKKMVEVEEKVRTYTVEMTEAEAQVVAALLGRMGGADMGVYDTFKLYDKLTDALDNNDVNYDAIDIVYSSGAGRIQTMKVVKS